MRRRRRLRWLSIAGLVLGVIGASVAATAPAAATIPGLVRVQNTVGGLNLAVAAKVICPSDYLVYGLGGEIVGGNGQVHLVSMLPDPVTLDSVTVIAVPLVPAVAPWSVTAYAICGRPTLGLHVEVMPAPAPADTEVCNGASRLWGVGARQDTSPGATLREMAPDAPFAPPSTSAASVAGAGGNVAAAAICGQVLGQFSIVAPAFAVGSTVTCPGATRVHGAGGLIIGNDPKIVFEGIVPNAALTQVRVTARDTGGPRPTKAFAVCA